MADCLTSGLIAHFQSVLPSGVLEDNYKLLDILDEMQPDEPCWHLALLSTDPVYVGKGYGSMLVEHIVQRCDANQEIAYLENTNPVNTAFYQRHGFKVTGEMQAGRSPTIFAMRRDPRQ